MINTTGRAWNAERVFFYGSITSTQSFMSAAFSKTVSINFSSRLWISLVIGSVLSLIAQPVFAEKISFKDAGSLSEDSQIKQAGYLNSSSFLDALSDEELINLYASTYQESLQSQTIDETRLVGRGKSILRLGYSFGYDRDDDDFKYIQHTFPRLRLRHRLTDRLEIRLGWSGAVWDEVTDELTDEKTTDTRYADLTFGFRYALTEPEDWFPRTAITVSTPLDIENDITFMNRMSPQVSLGYSWDCSDEWLLSGNTGAIWANEGGERYLDLQQGVGLTYFFERDWAVSFDWYAIFPEGNRLDGMEHYLGPGVTCDVSQDMQLGFDASFGLNENSPDVVTQFSVTWAF